MKGMILSAGLGTRLGELTRTTPKCLIDVGGMPMLERVAQRLKQAGVDRLAINTHHLAPLVREFVGARGAFDIEVQLFHEQAILGTGGGVKNARTFLESDTDFILHNADIYCEYDLRRLVQTHRAHGAIATLAVLDRRTDSCLLRDGVGRMRGLWKEGEALPAQELEAVTFCGIHVVSPRIFQYMDNKQGEFSILSPYLRALAAGETLITHHLGGAYWIDIGTPQQLQELRARLG